MNHRSRADAPGKVILFGEHAVVYGRPAIAIPVTKVKATATVQPADEGITVRAADLGHTLNVDPGSTSDPLGVAVIATLQHLDVGLDHPLSVRVTSTIPMGGGFGSSAAISAAIVRAIGRYFETDLPPEDVSRLVYKTEIIHHGTPSGIDNTVVAYAQPVYFVRGQPIERFVVGHPLHLIIADTGIMTPTRETVGSVRAGWQQEPETYERLFDEIQTLVDRARTAIARGDVVEIGRLMDENHTWLQQLDVSCAELDHLVHAARGAGALGAKMTGGGRGGNIVSIMTPQAVEDVANAVREAGATRVIETVVS